jgi:hypothetical protein
MPLVLGRRGGPAVPSGSCRQPGQTGARVHPSTGQRVSEHRRRSERIALIGTGGISHWRASPDSGKIDEAFDRALVDRWSWNDRSPMLAYTDEQIYREAGAGAFEIRAWIALATGARGRGELWHYAAYLFTPLLCRSLI